MNDASTQSSSDKNENWLHKGMATLTRMARPGGAKPLPPAANPLRDIFADLFAYVVFFLKNCENGAPALAECREKIVALLNAQEQRVNAGAVPADRFNEARFAVLSWVDEMILNSAWPQRAQWQHLMLTYYGTLNAGEEFFQKLDLLPPHAADVREIYYTCLSLGFEGKHAFGDGHRVLNDLKQRLYKQLSAAGGDIRQHYARLFPEAYQKAPAAPREKPKSQRHWYIIAALVPLVLFLIFSAFLWRKSNAILNALSTPAPASAPAPAPAVNWATSLVQELRKKGLRAVDEPDLVRITLETLIFGPGRSDLNPQAEDRIKDIVNTVRRYAPERIIVVEGHASREAAGDESRNLLLSEQRAQTVAEMFTRLGFQRGQISAKGFGSQRPVALNDTEQGRMQNRRVEIIIKK
jgi:type VI secretion system protein ImpK